MPNISARPNILPRKMLGNNSPDFSHHFAYFFENFHPVNLSEILFQSVGGPSQATGPTSGRASRVTPLPVPVTRLEFRLRREP